MSHAIFVAINRARVSIMLGDLFLGPRPFGWHPRTRPQELPAYLHRDVGMPPWDETERFRHGL